MLDASCYSPTDARSCCAGGSKCCCVTCGGAGTFRAALAPAADEIGACISKLIHAAFTLRRLQRLVEEFLWQAEEAPAESSRSGLEQADVPSAMMLYCLVGQFLTRRRQEPLPTLRLRPAQQC